MEFAKMPPIKDQLMKCVRCGKCRSVCPVFSEVGNETVAPRGHVFMVQMLRDGQVKPDQELYDKLANCLLCETCTVNCPSGLDIHELNAAARSYIYQKKPSIGKNLIFDTLWTRPGLLRSSTRILRGVQKCGLQKMARATGLTKILPGDLPQAEQILSELPARSARSQLKEINPARGDQKYRVGYFLGCATDLLNPNVAIATVEVLTRYGCEVIIPKEIKCCGLPHIANGKVDTARELAINNIKVLNSYYFDYIVTDCASCSSALSTKNMEFLLANTESEAEALQVADKVMDLTKFLVEILDIKPGATNAIEGLKVTYHDPCHLANAQGIKAEPRELLRRVPGLEYVEMKDANRCCGGSGTYSLTHYDMSMKILDKKMSNVMEAGANYLATCCPSCMMQLQHGLNRFGYPAQVVHPIELIAKCTE